MSSASVTCGPLSFWGRLPCVEQVKAAPHKYGKKEPDLLNGPAKEKRCGKGAEQNSVHDQAWQTGRNTIARLHESCKRALSEERLRHFYPNTITGHLEAIFSGCQRNDETLAPRSHLAHTLAAKGVLYAQNGVAPRDCFAQLKRRSFVCAHR
jgi:hypothetical protein